MRDSCMPVPLFEFMSRLHLYASNGLKFCLQDHLVFGLVLVFFVCLVWFEYICVCIVSVNKGDRSNILVNVDIPCAFCLVALDGILPLICAY